MQAACALRPDDVLLSLLVLRPTADRRIVGISREIHEMIYRLKESFPEVFADFTFTSTTLYPYSEELASAMGALQWSRLVGMENPDFRVYFVKKCADEAFNVAVAPNLDPETRQQLELASEKFWEALSK